jgi:hypothetical protein
MGWRHLFLVLATPLSVWALPHTTSPISPPHPSQVSCASIQASVEEDLVLQKRISLLPLAEGKAHVCPGAHRLARTWRSGFHDDSRDGSIQAGRIGRQRALILLEGPAGSGHFWGVEVMTKVAGQLAVGCTLTTTTGWRNAPRDERARLAPLDWFTNNHRGRGRIGLWSSPAAHPQAAQMEHFLFRRLYRLEGKELVIDERATRREMGHFADLYAKWARRPANPNAELHAHAAEALGLMAEGKKCPEGLK